MTQEQYNTIVKLIKNGAPALAEELVTSFTNVVAGYQQLAAENAELKKKADKKSKEDKK